MRQWATVYLPAAAAGRIVDLGALVSMDDETVALEFEADVTRRCEVVLDVLQMRPGVDRSPNSIRLGFGLVFVGGELSAPYVTATGDADATLFANLVVSLIIGLMLMLAVGLKAWRRPTSSWHSRPTTFECW